MANWYQPDGRLSDRVGPRAMILAGWLFYAAIYLTFGWLHSAPTLIAVFLAYGLNFGLTEPAERAWVASLILPQLRGTAFGWYHCAIGLAALPASVVFGLLWQQWGAAIAFTAGAILAALAAALLPPVRANAPDAPATKGADA